MTSAFPRDGVQCTLLAVYGICAGIHFSDAIVTADTLSGWPKYLAIRTLALTLAAHLLEFVIIFMVLRSRVLKRLDKTDSIWTHFLPTILYGLGHWIRLTKPKKS